MISYSRNSPDQIPASAVKIIGLGGAGANMLERIALDSMEGAELLAINTDIRTLNSCLAKEKIQLGINLTKGLGSGGDPELGHQATLEAETQVREALKGQRIVFICTGLGGGTGSGAAPLITRIAREEGAFVVVFATMPFFFEGKRRREQAESALNQLAVLSNALVTFDNNRMGELVLAKQGIHEAFVAADRMISESIKAVIRLVIRPGLINVGLDELMSALRTTRSRCLFGSGIADGKDRASKALRNALSSPLLDQGALLKEAQTVLVHLSGGESLTLFEIELLMTSLQKYVPEDAHVLFGAAIDPSMGDNLSITLISALPEDALSSKEAPEQAANPKPLSEVILPVAEPDPIVMPELIATSEPEPVSVSPFKIESEPEISSAPLEPLEATPSEPILEIEPKISIESLPILKNPSIETPKAVENASIETDDQTKKIIEEDNTSTKNRPTGKTLWGSFEKATKTLANKVTLSDKEDSSQSMAIKSEQKAASPQSELTFEQTSKGRFAGETPNLFDGEDLDLPPFLRKKKP